MKSEFDELDREKVTVDTISANMQLYGLINESEVPSPLEGANNRHSSSVND